MDAFIYALVMVPAFERFASGERHFQQPLQTWALWWLAVRPVSCGMGILAFLWGPIAGSIWARENADVYHSLLFGVYVSGVHCAKHLAVGGLSILCRGQALEASGPWVEFW